MTISAKSETAPDPTGWLRDHGDYLYSFALARLRDANLAEDAVQETLLQALRGRERFRGQANFRTWLTSILKNQIANIYRQRSREENLQGDRVLDRLFDDKGKWRTAVQNWDSDPSAALEQHEFWSVLSDCLDRLPTRMGDVFSLRFFEHFEAEQVGQRLDIKRKHVLVLLHRARLRVWRCLSFKWFRSN